MKYFYYAMLLGVAIFFVYLIGVHVGGVKCRAKVANANYEQIIMNTKIMEQTNEDVLHTGVGNIRHILHEKYTIAD